MDVTCGPLAGVLDGVDAAAAAAVDALEAGTADVEGAVAAVRAASGGNDGWEILGGMAVAAHAAVRLDVAAAGAVVDRFAAEGLAESNPLAVLMLREAVGWRADGNDLPAELGGAELLAMLLECGDDRSAFVACASVSVRSEQRSVEFGVMLDCYDAIRRARRHRDGVDMLAVLGADWHGTLRELERSVEALADAER